MTQSKVRDFFMKDVSAIVIFAHSLNKMRFLASLFYFRRCFCFMFTDFAQWNDTCHIYEPSLKRKTIIKIS